MNTFANFINDTFEGIPTEGDIIKAFESIPINSQIILEALTNIKNQVDNESDQEIKAYHKNKIIRVFSYCFLHAKDLLTALLLAFTNIQGLLIKDMILDVENNALVATLYYKLYTPYDQSNIEPSILKNLPRYRTEFNQKKYYIFVLTQKAIDPHYGDETGSLTTHYNKNHYDVNFNDIHTFSYDNIDPNNKDMIRETEENMNQEDSPNIFHNLPNSTKPFLTRKYLHDDELKDYKTYLYCNDQETANMERKLRKGEKINITFEPHWFFQALQKLHTYNPVVIVGLIPSVMMKLHKKYVKSLRNNYPIYNLLISKVKGSYYRELPKLSAKVVKAYNINNLDVDIEFMLTRVSKIFRSCFKNTIKTYLIPIFLHYIVTEYPEMLMSIAYFVGSFKYDTIRVLEALFEVSGYEWNGTCYMPRINFKIHECQEDSNNINFASESDDEDCYTDEENEERENKYYVNFIFKKFANAKERMQYVWDNENKIMTYLDKGLFKCLFLIMYNNYPFNLHFLQTYCSSCYEYVNKNKTMCNSTKSANSNKASIV